MSASPRVVTGDVTIRWDGTSQRLARGTVIDVAPGSALEAAIGRGNLAPLAATAAPPAPPPAALQAPAAEAPPAPQAASAQPDGRPRRAPARAAQETAPGGDGT